MLHPVFYPIKTLNGMTLTQNGLENICFSDEQGKPLILSVVKSIKETEKLIIFSV